MLLAKHTSKSSAHVLATSMQGPALTQPFRHHSFSASPPFHPGLWAHHVCFSLLAGPCFDPALGTQAHAELAAMRSAALADSGLSNFCEHDAFHMYYTR